MRGRGGDRGVVKVGYNWSGDGVRGPLNPSASFDQKRWEKLRGDDLTSRVGQGWCSLTKKGKKAGCR